MLGMLQRRTAGGKSMAGDGDGMITAGEIFGRKFRWWVVMCGNGFVVLWLAVVSLPGFIERFNFIRGLLLLAYALSWILGSNFDLSSQKSAYVGLPVPPVARWASYVILVLMIAGGLLTISTDERYFSAALATFFLINVAGWMLFRGKVQRAVLSQRASLLQGHPDRIDLFDAVARYLTGNWQWHRFAAMLLTIAAAVAVSFSVEARESVSLYFHRIFTNWPVDAIASNVPIICLAMFVVVAEGWIWLMRLSVYVIRRRVGQEIANDTHLTDDARKRGGKRRHDVRPSSYAHRLQWPRYLGSGHGAAFLLSAKFLTDSDKFKPPYVKLCLVVFVLGLILAILSFVSLTIIHDTAANVHIPPAQLHQENSRAARKAWFDFGISTLLLLLGLSVVALAFQG